MLGKLKILICSVSVLVSACVTTEGSVRKEAGDATKDLRKGPESTPIRSITNFSSGLRCMDNMFLMYGVRDLVVITEDISDQTKKVSAGTKDMLITSVSEMTSAARQFA